jgi:anti-anti-sigma factor
MEVHKTVLSRIPLLKVTGDVDHLSAQALEEYVQDSLRADDPHLLLDLAQCPYLDSGGLSVLLYAVLEVRDKGWIGLIAPSSNLLRIFEITGLTTDPHVRVFSDLDEATAALESLAGHA